MKFMKAQLKKNTTISKIAVFGMKSVLKIRHNPAKIKALLTSCGLKSDMNVLDYGAGIGSYAFEAARLVGKRGSVIAADISSAMLAEVKKGIADEKLSNVKTQQVESYRDIKNTEFDFIFLIDVLHMMDQPKEVLRCFLGKLGPNGKLLAGLDHLSKDEITDLLAVANCNVENKGANFWLLSKDVRRKIEENLKTKS